MNPTDEEDDGESPRARYADTARYRELVKVREQLGDRMGSMELRLIERLAAQDLKLASIERQVSILWRSFMVVLGLVLTGFVTALVRLITGGGPAAGG